MSRLRYNGLATGSAGSLTALSLGGSLSSGATSVTFNAALTYDNGTAVPTITGSDYIPLSILDTNGLLSEVVYLTAYTTAGTTGTITRGQEGTAGVAHSSGDKIAHAPTSADFLAPAYLGKNAIGASWFTTTTYGTYKKITTTGAAQLLGIEAYVRMTTDSVSGMGVALITDNAGTPDRLIAIGGYPAITDQMILNNSGSETGASAQGRWLAFSIAYQLAAATSYWIGIHVGDTPGQIDIAYDTSGSDRTMTGATWLADWGRYTAVTTTRDHSIRANVLS